MSHDRNGVDEFFRRFCDTWKTNDGGAVGDMFTDDGSLINPFGQRADGRSAVSAMYSDYFGGLLKGTSTTFELGTVRPVDSSHSFADGEQTIMAADGSILLVAHLAALLRHEGDGWRFVDSRPYTVAPLPA